MHCRFLNAHTLAFYIVVQSHHGLSICLFVICVSVRLTDCRMCIGDVQVLVSVSVAVCVSVYESVCRSSTPFSCRPRHEERNKHGQTTYCTYVRLLACLICSRHRKRKMPKKAGRQASKQASRTRSNRHRHGHKHSHRHRHIHRHR